MQRWLEPYCGRERLHPLHVRRLTAYLLDTDWPCRVLLGASLLFELAWPALVLATSRAQLVVACCVGCCFHLGVVVASGIAFYCNPLAYVLLAAHATTTAAAAAASSTTTAPATWASLYGTAPAAVVCGLAAYAYCRSLDDWPFNEIPLFPFSWRQMDDIARHYDTYFLALRGPRDAQLLATGPDLVKLCFFAVPTVSIEPARKVLCADYATDDDRRAALAAFVRHTRLWIEPDTFECYNDVLKLDHKNKKNPHAASRHVAIGKVRGFGKKGEI